MTERLLEVEYKSGEFSLRFRPGRLRVIPGATIDHLRTANKEFLMAVRSFIDRAIERTEPGEKPAGRRRTKIEVKQEEETA